MRIEEVAQHAPEAAHAAPTPYEEFNRTIDKDHFPEGGMAARAAQALVNSYAWTDANPMLNLSSFVTTFAEPEAITAQVQRAVAAGEEHDAGERARSRAHDDERLGDPGTGRDGADLVGPFGSVGAGGQQREREHRGARAPGSDHARKRCERATCAR